MAYAADKKPGELTALTTLATDDVFIVGDTSDVSEVAKSITKADLITDLGSSFAAALGSDDNYVTDAEKAALHAAVTVTDGTTVNLTVTGQDITAEVIDGTISNAKLANVATSTIKGRVTAATGVPEDLTATQVRTLLNVADGANNYVHPNHSGDVTSVADGATTIANGAVTLAKQANVDTATVFYRKTAGAGAPEVQTLATLKTDLGLTGTNSGDQTTIVGITGTKAQFDTAVTDGNFMYVGDAPTSHTHTLSAITDVTASVAEVNVLDGIPGTLTATELGYVDGVTSAIQTQLNAKASTTAPTLTGTTTVDRLDYDRAVGLVSAIGNLGATETFDWSTATHFTGNLDANITVDFSNAVSGQSITVYYTYSGAARTMAYTPTIVWCDGATGVAPTPPQASGNVLIVTYQYIGTTYFGSATGNYAVY